jgi:hypothetical protein
MINLTLDRLDDEERRTLLVAAVQAWSSIEDRVAPALGVDQGDVEERLETQARRHALVSRAATRYRIGRCRCGH